jgi:selenocysteine-specific elongation factor
VLREAGRRQTVAGGVVLDVEPGKATQAPGRLASRLAAPPADLPALVVQERGAIPTDDEPQLVGSPAGASTGGGRWAVAPDVREASAATVTAMLQDFHAGDSLAAGAPLDEVRARVAATLRRMHAPTDRGLVDEILEAMATAGTIERTAAVVRMAGHRVSLDDHDADARRLLEAIGGNHASRPPSVADLEESGVARSVVEAAVSAGLAVRISRELVFTPELVARAEGVVRGSPDGITVSAFREALDTSRKYALPLLEHFDRTGVTRREGDLRFPR